MSELSLKKRILKEISKRTDVWYYKAADKFTSGIPDIIICQSGKFKAMEVKFGKGKLTPLQDYTIRKIRTAGGVADVVRSVDDARRILDGVG